MLESAAVPSGRSMLQNLLYVGAALLLVLLNGFFVAAEFALVKLRQTQAATLSASGSWRGRLLGDVHGHLDAYLSACQLGITLASLGLGWIGEPAFARLLEPLFARFGVGVETTQVVALVLAFTLISYLHIVLGELAPKSLALQRSEGTALLIVRPLGLFRSLFWPAIVSLNGLGNLVLRLCGLRPGAPEDSLHSPEELKLLIAASQEAGLLQRAQQELVDRVLSIGNRRITDIMTPRVDVEWVDADDDRKEILKRIRQCRHEQLLVGKGTIDEPIGMIVKKDLLDQVLDGKALDPMTVLRQPIALHEAMPVFSALSSVIETAGSEAWREAREAIVRELAAEGVPEPLARRHAYQPELAHGPDIIAVTKAAGRTLEEVASAFYLAGDRFHLDWLERRLVELPDGSRFDRWARQAVGDDAQQNGPGGDLGEQPWLAVYLLESKIGQQGEYHGGQTARAEPPHQCHGVRP